MNASEDEIGTGTVGESAPSAPVEESEAPASGVNPNPAPEYYHYNLVRARDLGRQIALHVIIDETGWLSQGIEILYIRTRHNTLEPITIRIGADAQDADVLADVLADGGPLALFSRFNAAIHKLRQLAERFKIAQRCGRMSIELVSAAELNTIESTIAARQAEHMGHGTVRILRIKHEAEFFENLYTKLAPLASAADVAMRPAHTSGASQPGSGVHFEE